MVALAVASRVEGGASWTRQTGLKNSICAMNGEKRGLVIPKALSESPRFPFMGRIKRTAVVPRSIRLSQQPRSESLLIILHFVNIVG